MHKHWRTADNIRRCFYFLRLRWTARMNEGVGGLIKNVEQLRFL